MRIATWASLSHPQYHDSQLLALLSPFGYVAPTADVRHRDLHLGSQIFIGNDAELLQYPDGGPLNLGDRVCIERRSHLVTANGGSITIGHFTTIGGHCEMMAYLANIRIGAHVIVASNCRFYPYDHGTSPGIPMQRQLLVAKGDIVIEDDVWVGTGSILLSGVHIGRGAVIAAGTVVAKNVAPGLIVGGNPARIIDSRDETLFTRPLLVDTEHDAFMVRNPDGTIKFWNKGAEHLYGWEFRETIGERSHNLLQTVFPVPLQYIEKELEHNGYWEGPLVHTRRDGSRLVVQSRWELQFDMREQSATVVEINSRSAA
jgi:PAS domain S-box-containing protein